jgi:hypothetical protein
MRLGTSAFATRSPITPTGISEQIVKFTEASRAKAPGASFKPNRIKPQPPGPVWHEGDEGHRAVGRASRIAR